MTGDPNMCLMCRDRVLEGFRDLTPEIASLLSLNMLSNEQNYLCSTLQRVNGRD